MSLRRVDEFDGKTDAEIVEFSIDGNVFEIDLSAESKRQMLRDLERYINAGRRMSGKGKKPAPKKPTNGAAPARSEKPANLDAVRDWARGTGRFKVSDRGRIPRDVVTAFEEAHPTNVVSPAFSGA
jgi:hypothetical protein